MPSHTNGGNGYGPRSVSEAFFGLKKQLSSAPILSFPNIHLQFVVDTDASGEGLGVALSQVVSGCEAYASRVLSSKE